MAELLFAQCNNEKGNGRQRRVRKRPGRGIKELDRNGKRFREWWKEQTVRRNYASLKQDLTRFVCKYTCQG